jgi:hypothetical protein
LLQTSHVACHAEEGQECTNDNTSRRVDYNTDHCRGRKDNQISYEIRDKESRQEMRKSNQAKHCIVKKKGKRKKQRRKKLAHKLKAKAYVCRIST